MLLNQAVFEDLVSEPLDALTESLTTDRAVLRQLLTQIRNLGYAVTRDDFRLGAGSLAAPILAADGGVAGGVRAIVKAEELAHENRAEILVGACVRTV